jgi:hypothetical protein
VSAKVIVLGVVARDGNKCPIIFVPDSEKVTADSYQVLLRRHVIPCLSATSPEGNYIFQQDGAPAHTPNFMQKFIESNMVVHWSKMVWPTYSPDLNPQDYGIWGVLQAKVTPPATKISAMMCTIWQEWHRLSEAMIWQTCRMFRLGLKKVVAAYGGYID